MRKRRKSLRLPNGLGTIQYLGEKRRQPYQAVVTLGYDNKGKQLRKSLGVRDTWDKAYQLLLDYSNQPYNLDFHNITLRKVFELYQPILEKDMLNEKMSKSNYRNLITSSKHLEILFNNKITEIKKRDMQMLLDSSELGHTAQGYIKNIAFRLFNYAIEELELPIVKNPCVNLKIIEKKQSTMHKPFSVEEIQSLWNNSSDYYCKLALIYLYTGVRPSELLEIKTSNVFLDEDYMIGGNKTEAGRNRIIPIHPAIKEIVNSIYNIDNKYLVINPNTNDKMSYDTWQKRFDNLMKEFGYNHNPHDTRHTFSTYLKFCGVSEVDRKWLMGHSFGNDVTNNVYTHIDHKYLLNEIKKLKYE